MHKEEDHSSEESEVDVGHVRKRFNELLDDTLSLYETQSIHDNGLSCRVAIKQNFDYRSQSAAPSRYMKYVNDTDIIERNYKAYL